MANLIEAAKRQIDELVNAAYVKAAEKGELPEGCTLSGTIEIPKDAANGDYACNYALTAARSMRRAPLKIAEALLAEMDLTDSFFSEVKIGGAGFINFTLAEKWYSSVVRTIDAEQENYGRADSRTGEKIIVEFVSANPTGPMHMGNARGGVLGDTLAEVLDRAGCDVWKEFYVNDAGNQIHKFAVSINARYMQLIYGEENFEFPEDGYHGQDIVELAKGFYEQYGDSYVAKPEDERLDAMAAFGLERNIPKMKSDLKRYKIEYDRWFLESELHNSGLVAETVQKLTDAGYTYEKDGALWLETSRLLHDRYVREGKTEEQIAKLELKDDVLCRGNGFYTYFAADIAYHRNKLETRGFDKAINIWGADHHGHVARLQVALDALGLDGSNRLIIVLMQLVNLLRDGQAVRMSKRTGKAIALEDLLDEISVDAARYFFNSRTSDTHLDFDLGLAVRQDSENPVYYVQYAHARICSLTANLKEAGYAVDPAETLNLALLTAPEEKELIKALAMLPEEIRLAARDYDPSRINRYLVELAANFHRFYNACRIKGEEPELLAARLKLADTVRSVIANGLVLLGVDAPTHM